MSQQNGIDRYADWEKHQSQQFRQQQCGYLDLPYVPSKKGRKFVAKPSVQTAKTQVVKVWHEGAD